MKKGLIVLVALILLAGCNKKEAITTSNDAQETEVTQAVQETTDGTDTEKADGTDTEKIDGEEQPEGFNFVVNNIMIPMNADTAPILEALGEPEEYFEAISCAFQGMDKIYTYNGFEINTYPIEDKDYIASVYFLDDSVTTEEGICLGATLDEVIAAYGEGYTEKSGEYIYTLGQSKLSFIIKDDCVASITYSAIVEGLE